MLYSRQEAVLSAVLMMAGLLPFSAKAHDFFLDDEEQLIDTLHTHLYSSLKRLPSFQEFQIASVCFISDTEDCSGYLFGNTEDLIDGDPEDYNPDDEERCKKEGYLISSCPDGYKPGGLKCPYDDYYTKCVPACPSNYVECTEPYFGVGEACDGKYASCDCTPCGAGYTYTSIPKGYLQDGEGCLDCDGVTKYKVKINPCDGFLDCGDMGGAAGAKTCQSGDKIKYDNCKPCPNLGNLTSCPSPFTCVYEKCSNLYYKSGCQAGYNWNATAQTCTLQCENSYKYTCTGANQTGGSGSACDGKYTACVCSNGYKWENGSCAKIFTSCTGVASNCALGDILYSDGTCGINTGKTSIAIVVYISGKCGQAMALNPIGMYDWGPGGIDEDVSGVTNYGNSPAASINYTSCENSARIIATGNKSVYPAAWAAHEYSTEGTAPGDWCLPAAGILTNIYNNQSQINAGFSRAGGSQFTYDTEAWSSSEGNPSTKAWYSNFTESYGIDDDYKYAGLKEVRPIIEF